MALHNRLGDERGIALIMAVGIMFVLALALTTVIFFSTSNEQAARYASAEQDAFSLAEAGINNAYGVLAKRALATPNSPVTDNTLLQPAKVSTYQNGSVSWTGSYSAITQRWTLVATGTARNRSGGSDVTRTVSSSVIVAPTPGQTNNVEMWNYVAMRSTGAACDLDLTNSMDLSSRLYVPGNLCVQAGSDITGGPLLVTGDVTLVGNPTRIGSAATPIPAAALPHPSTAIGGRCKHHNNLRMACRSGPSPANSNIWVSGVANGSAISTAPPALSFPPADFAARYADANPGPNNDACVAAPGSAAGATILPAAAFDNDGDLDQATDGSVATSFDLTPSTSYTCKTSLGELSWNNATKRITVTGTVFIDGSAFSSGSGHNPKTFDYDGRGVLYLTGTMLFENGASICAVISSGDCNWSAWNPDADMLMIVADGNGGQVPVGRSVLIENSSHYQGGLYATNSVEFQNQAYAQGPILGETLFAGNNASALSFPYITVLPAGAPGNPFTTYTLVKENFVD